MYRGCDKVGEFTNNGAPDVEGSKKFCYIQFFIGPHRKADKAYWFKCAGS